jgi:hypothetical protein
VAVRVDRSGVGEAVDGRHAAIIRSREAVRTTPRAPSRARRPSRVPEAGPSRPRRRGAWLVAALVLAALGASCSGEPSSGRRAGAGAAQADPAPAPGRAVIERRAGGLLLLANEAPRRAILRELSGRYGFALEDYDASDPRVRVSLVDVSLQEALEVLLEGTPHRIEYELDPYDGQGGLVRVVVGRDPEAGAETPDDS